MSTRAHVKANRVGHQNLGNEKKLTVEDERRSNYDRSPSNIRLMLTFLLAVIAYVSAFVSLTSAPNLGSGRASAAARRLQAKATAPEVASIGSAVLGGTSARMQELV